MHSYTKAGLYDVKLIVSDGTQYDTLIKKNYIQIFNNTSVEYTKEEIPPFSPNPVKDKLFIKTTEFNNTDKIQIFDLNGRKLIETELKDIIDVTSLSKGIYIHKIDNKEWKFVKE